MCNKDLTSPSRRAAERGGQGGQLAPGPKQVGAPRDAGTGGGQEGQLPPLPFAGRGKGGKSAL